MTDANDQEHGQDQASLSPAGEAFAEFLARVEDGDDPDFEAFCEEHAPLADDLRKLHGRWLQYLAPAENDAA